MIILYILIFILFLTYNCKEYFTSQQENDNYYQYCLGNYSLKKCVPDKKCLKYGFNKICS